MITRAQAETFYDDIERFPTEQRVVAMRAFGARDLYYLLTRICRRTDAQVDWVYNRCLEVQANPDGMLDLWFRGGYKSSIITQTLTIQEIILNPELRIAIFSHTRPAAVAFLRQIKIELETNPLLHKLWPEIFWHNPKRESARWSDHGGLILRRQGNPQEATVEAWGVVDGMPTGKHFDLVIYDDLVSQEQVGSEGMIRKTTEAWENSLNLVDKNSRRRYIGTRWHHADTYQEMIRRGAAEPRIYASRDEQGQARFYDDEQLDQKRREMGPFTYSAQMDQNPTADTMTGFQENWLKYYEEHTVKASGLNCYIVADLAHSLKKNSDYTAIWVIGLSSDRNYYCIDYIRDRLKPVKIIDKIMDLHRHYNPYVKGVGIEQYGAMAHADMLRDRQQRENYRFEVTELGGRLKKTDRINRLQPLFKDGRIYMMRELIRRDYEGKFPDIIRQFIDFEYLAWPAPTHDDGLDSMARILDEDLNAIWPRPKVDRTPRHMQRHGSVWAA